VRSLTAKHHGKEKIPSHVGGHAGLRDLREPHGLLFSSLSCLSRSRLRPGEADSLPASMASLGCSTGALSCVIEVPGAADRPISKTSPLSRPTMPRRRQKRRMRKARSAQFRRNLDQTPALRCFGVTGASLQDNAGSRRAVEHIMSSTRRLALIIEIVRSGRGRSDVSGGRRTL